MGKRSKTGVLKRLREVKKQERAAMKQAEAQMRRDTTTTTAPEDMVATVDDMAGYGFPVADEEEEDES